MSKTDKNYMLIKNVQEGIFPTTQELHRLDDLDVYNKVNMSNAKVALRKTANVDSLNVKILNNKIKLCCPGNTKEKSDLLKKMERYNQMSDLSKQAVFMEDGILAKRLYAKFKLLKSPKHKKKVVIMEEEQKKKSSKTSKLLTTSKGKQNTLWYFNKPNIPYKINYGALDSIDKLMEQTPWEIPKLIDESERITLRQWDAQNVMKSNDILKYDEYQDIIIRKQNVMEKIKAESKPITICEKSKFIYNINIKSKFPIEDQPTASNTFRDKDASNTLRDNDSVTSEKKRSVTRLPSIPTNKNLENET